MSDKKTSTLYELAILGDEYTEERDIEVYGEETTVVISPLSDGELFPIVGVIMDTFDVDFDNTDEADIDQVREEMDEARDEEGSVDPSNLDDQFVGAVQTAAIKGIAGAVDDDGEFIEHSEEENERLVNALTGGTSIELGMEVLDVTGDADDAEKFR